MNKDEYDVSGYSDRELYVLMDLDDPSDRVLEAKILQLIKKYENIDNKIGQKFFNFFQDVFDHFFGDEDEGDEALVEGFTTVTTDTANIPPPVQNSVDVIQKNYSKGALNPILKETIKRIVCVDSQYRDTAVYPISTAFTFNLSDNLVDVVSLKLYSVQIPFTWFTISNDFGSNFFYLKGTSPGLNQGNFDYKLSIMAGNYQAADFQNSINTSFMNNIFSVNPDINFGTTGVSYNKINAKLTTTIDIENIFNETNYNLIFPTFDDYSVDASNVLSIPQLLGYKNTIYEPCSIFSTVFTALPSDNYLITSKNNAITIYLYQGQLSTLNHITEFGTDSSYSTIKIVSTLLGSYTPAQIVTDIQNQISISPYLKSTNSTLQLHNYYNSSQFKLNIVLNRKNVNNAVNLKSVVYFQEDPSINSLWTGSTSLFQFDSSYNELNNVLSETSNVTTTYVIDSSPTITLTCKNPYYLNIPSNNQIINVLNSTYNSRQYIAAINNGMQQLKINTNNNFNCWIDISNSLMVPTISCDISNTIPFLDNVYDVFSNNFVLDISFSILHTICNFPTQIKNKTTISTFQLQAGGYNFDSKSNFFKVYSIGPRNKNVPEGIITISSGSYFEYLENMFDAINASFQTNMLNNVDLSQTNITFSLGSNGIVTCTLNLNIQAKLTSNDYELSFYNTGYNSWYNFLGFQNLSYNLIQISNSQIAKVSSIYPFYTNELLLLPSNNSFTINPVYDPSGGVYTITNDYQITKTLSLPTNVYYTKEDIVANINLILLQDTFTTGSYVDISKSITKIRVNVNKIFTAQDYRLVFFDKSFTHCNYGYPSSIENIKWDTTMGWLLGYRNLAEYNLTSTHLSNNGYYDSYTNQLYTVGTTNIVTLTGDTSINVNLYNYVMIILDDYCQNHLNDGLVTITKQDYDIPLPSYANRSTYKCDPTTGNYSIASTGQVDYNNLTAKQIYSANQILNTQTIKQSQNIYSPGPYVQDIFGLVPIKTAGLQPGQSFIEFGGTLQNQERSYFGPVNISKMSIQLLNDKGTVLDLNNANWSFSFLVEMLYNPQR